MTNEYKPIRVTCIRKSSYLKYIDKNTHLYKLLINTSSPLFFMEHSDRVPPALFDLAGHSTCSRLGVYPAPSNNNKHVHLVT